MKDLGELHPRDAGSVQCRRYGTLLAPVHD
jgi:hypothetical protein